MANKSKKELHFVKVPENCIIIDFDLPDENGNKRQSLHLLYINNTIERKKK